MLQEFWYELNEGSIPLPNSLEYWQWRREWGHVPLPSPCRQCSEVQGPGRLCRCLHWRDLIHWKHCWPVIFEKKNIADWLADLADNLKRIGCWCALSGGSKKHRTCTLIILETALPHLYSKAIIYITNSLSVEPDIPTNRETDWTSNKWAFRLVCLPSWINSTLLKSSLLDLISKIIVSYVFPKAIILDTPHHICAVCC
jgi:hypothetical protein